MHAISANVAGQIGSVVAGGVVIKIVGEILKNMG
jgi:oxaloacetate decarboxylase beta subunit